MTQTLTGSLVLFNFSNHHSYTLSVIPIGTNSWEVVHIIATQRKMAHLLRPTPSMQIKAITAQCEVWVYKSSTLSTINKYCIDLFYFIIIYLSVFVLCQDRTSLPIAMLNNSIKILCVYVISICHQSSVNGLRPSSDPNVHWQTLHYTQHSCGC